MDTKILVVDDESAIADIIKFNFEREGYAVDIAKDGLEALDFVKKTSYSLVLLDIMMPKLNGFDTLKELRKESEMPVIMITAREDEVDKILGLELGADDYVVKPFSIRELLARVKAVLRRFTPQGENADQFLEIGELEINLNKYEVKKNNKIIELTLREFELLKFMATNAGTVFSREELLEKVWDYEYYGDIRTVDVTIRRLREKIEDTSKDYKYIITKRGVGYYFDKEAD